MKNFNFVLITSISMIFLGVFSVYANAGVEHAEVSGVNAKEFDENFKNAISSGNAEAVRLIIDNGSDVNAKDAWGNTPLLLASCHNNIEIIRLLIEKGADVNAKDNHGWTPLITAANYKHTEIIKLLIDKGADVNAKDNGGDTPLTKAASIHNDEVIKLLINKGANENDVTGSGRGVLFPLYSVPFMMCSNTFSESLSSSGYSVCSDDFDKECKEKSGIVRWTDLHPVSTSGRYCYKKALDNGKECSSNQECLSGSCDLEGAVSRKGCIFVKKELSGEHNRFTGGEFYTVTYSCNKHKVGLCADAPPAGSNPAGTEHIFKMEGDNLIEIKRDGPIM